MVEPAHCGLMDTIMQAAAVEEIGRQVLLLVTGASVAAVAGECRVLVQPALGEVLHLIAVQMVLKVIPIQEILQGEQLAPILAVEVVVPVKASI
jgi:hypothetical protein